VVFTAYGNPALDGAGQACPAGQKGFDAHPVFAADHAVLS
jgi:hypothetical protein